MGDLLRRRALMAEASSAETWDYEWDYLNGIAMTDDGWTLVSSGLGTCELRNTETNKGQLLASDASSSYRTLRNPSRFNVPKGIMQVTFYLTGWNSSTSSPSTRICLSNGSEGIQVCTPNGELRLFDNTSPGDGTSLGVTLVKRQIYTMRLILDGSVGSIYLNDVLLASNVNISAIQYSANTSIWSQNSDEYSTYIQTVKLKLNRIV